MLFGFLNQSAHDVLSSAYLESIRANFMSFAQSMYTFSVNKLGAKIKSKIGASTISNYISWALSGNNKMTSGGTALKKVIRIISSIGKKKIHANDMLEILRFVTVFMLGGYMRKGLQLQYNAYSEKEFNKVADFAFSVAIMGLSSGLSHVPANHLDNVYRKFFNIKSPLTPDQKAQLLKIYKNERTALKNSIIELYNILESTDKYLTLSRSNIDGRFEIIIDDDLFWKAHESGFRQLLKTKSRNKTKPNEAHLREKFKSIKIQSFGMGIIAKINTISERIEKITDKLTTNDVAHKKLKIPSEVKARSKTMLKKNHPKSTTSSNSNHKQKRKNRGRATK